MTTEETCKDDCVKFVDHLMQRPLHPSIDGPDHRPWMKRELARECESHGDYVYNSDVGACVSSPTSMEHCTFYERGYVRAMGSHLWTFKDGNKKWTEPQCVASPSSYCPGHLQASGKGNFYCCPLMDSRGVAPTEFVC